MGGNTAPEASRKSLVPKYVMIYGSLLLLTGDSQHQVLGRQIKEMSTEKKGGISQRKYVGRHFANGKWKIYLKVPLKTSWKSWMCISWDVLLHHFILHPIISTNSVIPTNQHKGEKYIPKWFLFLFLYWIVIF